MSISIFRKIAIVGIVLTALLGIGFFATSDVSPVQTPLVEAFGGGGGGGCGGCGGDDDDDDDPEPITPPACVLSANPNTIDKDESSNLSWNTSNAYTASINQGVGTVAVGSGQESVSPDQTTTYTMTVQNNYGQSATCSTQVTVVQPTPQPQCAIDVSPTTIDKGDSSTLAWTTTNATVVSFNQGIGSVSLDGSRTVSPVQTTTYTLTAENADGDQVNCLTKVTVIQPTPQPQCSLSAQPTTIDKGDNSTLAWTTNNATEVSINQGIGSVSLNGSKSVSPVQTTTYTLTAENADGDQVNCSTKVTVIQPTPQPQCAIDVSPTTIDKGDSSTLAWTTTNATVVSFNQGIGSVSLDGSRTVSPVQTTTYTLTAENADGDQVNCLTKVTVIQPTPQPQCVIDASPNTIIKGDTSLLTWSTVDADTASINQGIGNVSTGSGQSLTVTPSQTTTYTMTVENNSGDTANCQTTVTVKESTPIPECTLNVNPDTLPDGGGNVTLAWTTENADDVSINQGIGDVSDNGSRTASITKSTIFTLTAENEKGDVTCSAEVEVKDPEPDPITCEDNVHFSANPSTIKKGNSTELKWTTSGITSVSINQGIGSVSLDGSRTVSPSSDITYTLTASDGDDTISCPVSVDIDSGGGGGALYPECELDISDTKISSGQSVTLEWDSEYASDVEITDDRGNIIVTTYDRLSDDKARFLDGDTTVKPTRDTTYIMVADRNGREDECKVKVEIEDDIVVIEDRDQKPLVSGISLTHVPYTGFEAGPMLTMLFYTLLTLWALFVAYVYIIRRNKALKPVSATGMYTPASMQQVVNPDLFASHGRGVGYTTAVANVATSLPKLCPDSSAQVGWNTAESTKVEDETLTETATSAESTQLESQAHDKQVLISQDAVIQFIDMYGSGQHEMFDTILDYARSMYTNESGWVVLNTARMHELLQSA